MGQVHAREPRRGYHEDAAAEDGDDDLGVDLGSIGVRVTKVHLKGLQRTKDDMVVASIEPVLKVKQFSELALAAQEARARLQSLQCFKTVEILIDTSEGGGSKDYEVTFVMDEVKRVQGAVNTMVGNQEGSLTGGIKFPNLLGRGEKLQVDYTQGTKKSKQFNASLAKPIFSQTLSDEQDTPLLATVTSSIFQRMFESLPSSYKETSRGGLIDLSFLSAPQVAHNLQLEGVWRQLHCLDNSTAFAVRQQCGHTLKSSIRHILTVDRRDHPVFPTEGSQFRLTQEFAGLGGDIGFFKNEVEVQANVPLDGLIPFSKFFGPGVVFQSTFHAGHTRRTEGGGSDKTVTLSDNFFLGGPLSVRGFDLRGLGPSSEGHATGGLSYWATGLHLYTPLPFRRQSPQRSLGSGDSGQQSSFGDLFRTHAFVTAGNLMPSFSYSPRRSIGQNVDEAIRNFRMSYGLGIVMSLGGIARVELNYCYPLRAQRSDKIAPGLQVGVGLDFL